MAVPDYLYFEFGNSISESYSGEWYQTDGLFGYFEKYRVHADGTIWLTPTQLAPTGRMQIGIDAPELAKIDRPPVRIMLDSEIELIGEQHHLIASFADGVLRWLTNRKDNSQYERLEGREVLPAQMTRRQSIAVDNC